MIAWIFLSGLSCYTLARCPTHKELQATLQQLMAAHDPRGQVGSLQNWQRNWQQCGYPTDSTYIEGLLQLGLSHRARLEFTTATQIVQQAVKLCRIRRPDMRPDQPSKALFRLGLLLVHQRQTAVETLRQAIRQGQDIRLADRWVAGAYLYLAFAYYSAGDFQQAITSVENGELIATRAIDKTLLTLLLQEKIKSLNELGQYEAAHLAAERALTLAKQEGYPAVIARAYQVLGDIAEKQNQLTSALQYLLRAFAIAQANQDVSAPNYSVSIGILYTKLQQYKKAVSYFQYGVEKNTNAYDKAYSLTMLGQVYTQQKEYTKALQYYQQGLITMPIGFHNLAVSSLPDPQSIRLANQKEYLLTLIRSKANAWLTYAKTTKLNRKLLQQALATFKVADQMVDFMRWEQTGQQSKLYWRQTTRNIYEQAIETCYQLNDTQQAFRFMEKSRAVLLADKLNELGAQRQLLPEQAKEEQRLRQRVSTQQNDLANLAPDSARYAPLRLSLSTSQDSLEQFLKQLEASSPAYYRYKYDNTTPSLTDLQRYLNQRQAALLTYFVGDSALYILAVTDKRMVLRKQPVGPYNQTLRQFTPLLATTEALRTRADVSRFITLSHDLYNQLLAPLKLPKGRVVVSPDGFFIPFDALSRSATQAQYALDDYAFSYVYSVRLLLKNRDLSHQSFGLGVRDFLGVAPVDFAPSLKQVILPNSDAALQPIASRFGSPLLLTHEAATRRAFLTQAPKAHIVHLFTHAVADSTQEEPRLYFADSTLQLSDLEDGAMPQAQLVVLAACKTGIGANQRGEGVFSLARGFAALGVPSVLTTLWSVQNEATYQLTDLFYQYLDKGFPKDIALQRAKQDWLNTTEGVNQLPTYWAGLIIVGDTEPLTQTHYIGWAIGLSSVVIIGLSGWWVWRRRQRVASLR